MTYSVALVDDHPMMRNGLAATVNVLKDYKVTIEASNGSEFIDFLQENKLPDIAIIDLNMPVMDGFETLTWMRENSISIRTLALTFDPREDVMLRAIKAGARGFLLKNIGAAELKAALDSLIHTGWYYGPGIKEVLLQEQTMTSRFESQREKIKQSITPREMELLQHLCSEEEYTYEGISNLMGVSRRTVDSWRESLFQKLQVKSKTGLVMAAIRWQLVRM
jgi:two-component system, NarL family, invasion response regulator UvrY